MTDFLLELLSEEIPARMQDGARAELGKLFAAQMAAAGLLAEDVIIWSTPRRLALIARGLPLETAAVSEEYKGPRTSAPPQALEGFLRKTGLTQDQLEDRDGVWFATVEKPGRATVEVLADAIPAIVRGFSWPKSMRWGRASSVSESLRWVRPLQGIVAIFGEELVPCEVDGIASGYATKGHRFHHSGDITIGGAHDYAGKLRACHVIVDQEERRAIIRDACVALTHVHGLTWIADEALVAENAGLTEWPVPLLGDFDPAFLEVPPEVVRLTLATNQKYFVASSLPSPSAGGRGNPPRDGEVARSDGGGSPPRTALEDDNPLRPLRGHLPASGEDFSLAPAFICTANIEASDGGAAIVAGNRKVLAARLSDARFFWEQDKKTPLAVHAEKLSRITFHEKLGTVEQRQSRFVSLANDFQGQLADSVADAREACAILKCDLVTEMVGEFPELQGVMGGYYAGAEGRSASVAAAVRDHYKPLGQSDALPTEPAAILTALIDKIDALVGFFGADLKPTGSKDPFALRRAALGVIRLITENGLRLRLRVLFTAAAQLYRNQGLRVEDAAADLLDFFADRLKVQQREAGVRHDLIDAVFALGGEDDLVRLLARVKALQAFVGTADGVNLLAGYKRAANILKKESVTPAKAGVGGEGAPSAPAIPAFAGMTFTPEPAEAALIAALDVAEPAAAAAVAGERFEEAMAALASLRAPIDAFFESVTVNDADPAKRAARLGLLARLTAAVEGIADFSRIEG